MNTHEEKDRFETAVRAMLDPMGQRYCMVAFQHERCAVYIEFDRMFSSHGAILDRFSFVADSWSRLWALLRTDVFYWLRGGAYFENGRRIADVAM